MVSRNVRTASLLKHRDRNKMAASFFRQHFQTHFLEWNYRIFNRISLKYVPMGPTIIMPSSLTHICVTRPVWVKWFSTIGGGGHGDGGGGGLDPLPRGSTLHTPAQIFPPYPRPLFSPIFFQVPPPKIPIFCPRPRPSDPRATPIYRQRPAFPRPPNPRAPDPLSSPTTRDVALISNVWCSNAL